MPAFRLGSPTPLSSSLPLRHGLLQFLTLFRSYLESRGFNWPGHPASSIDYDKLSRILLSPDDSLPSEMVGALLFVDEMSSDDRMDQLLAACMKEDIAMRVLMHSGSGAFTISPDGAAGRDAFRS